MQSILKHSLFVFLVVTVLCWIVIIYGAVDITHAEQMGSIMLVLYFSCRLYQGYRREIESEYLLLGGNYAIEKLFVVLSAISLLPAVWIDLLTVSKF